MAEVHQLRTHYVNNLKDKVFFKEDSINGKTYCIFYIHDINIEEESFVDTFSQYFPFYVWNEDQIQFIDIDNNAENNLGNASKKCWNSEIVPTRKTKSNGIYGEVFLDFYERIVHGRRLISTYASRRAFSSNSEAKGYDHIGYILNNGVLELVIGEAKYVSTVYSAKDALVDDINGKFDSEGKWHPGHLTTEYFNRFLNFIIQKKESFSTVEKNEIQELMSELNRELVLGNGEFLQYIITHNMKLNCVFFAIFQNNSNIPKNLELHYDKIHQEAVNALNVMGVTNYSIEIVFVPTDLTSMHIKEKIDEFYE